jgi:uncharacterized protein (TIGR03067 family)
VFGGQNIFDGLRSLLYRQSLPIQSKDGKSLYAGAVRVDGSAKPAAIDFEHREGVLKGKAWKGIYALDGDTLTIWAREASQIL